MSISKDSNLSFLDRLQVTANTENSSMSGYLHRSKGYKKPWKRLWFVIKNKVLYTYAASEVRRSSSVHSDSRIGRIWMFAVCSPQDVAALESQPLLGFFLREEKSGPAEKLQFRLYHKNILYYIFRADDIPTAQRYICTHTCTRVSTVLPVIKCNDQAGHTNLTHYTLLS